MSEQALREMLREAPVPGADEAERRGLRVAQAAFGERQPAHRPLRPRLALVFAVASLLTALLLSPAGAAVRDWIDDVVAVGGREAEPALTEVPGGGRLLVSSPRGPWVVQPDGSRRLLGEYAGAGWSPRGLFVAAFAGRGLSAVEPDGTVHWSLSASAPVRDPRWSPSGFRIAYRAGRTLRVVAGDGSGDRLLARRVAPVPAVWSSQGHHLLAYVHADGGLRIADADSGEVLGGAGPQPAMQPTAGATHELDWAAGGSRLLEVKSGELLLRALRVDKLAGVIRIGPARRLPLPAGAAVQSASFSPGGGTIAALLHLAAGGMRPARSEAVLIDPADGARRPLLAAPGGLSDLAWSPDGRRLLIAWPDADQWLFVPADGGARVRTVGDISAQFSPGAGPSQAAFPRIEGWCCALSTPRSP